MLPLKRNQKRMKMILKSKKLMKRKNPRKSKKLSMNGIKSTPIRLFGFETKKISMRKTILISTKV